jgi:hypothetical protein
VFFLVRSWAFLGKGSSKTPLKYFYKKSMSKTFPKEIDKKFDVSFSSAFWFYRVFGCFSAMGGQKHQQQKTFYRKILSKSYFKTIDKKSKTDFFLDFFLTFLGVSR